MLRYYECVVAARVRERAPHCRLAPLLRNKRERPLARRLARARARVNAEDSRAHESGGLLRQ